MISLRHGPGCGLGAWPGRPSIGVDSRLMPPRRPGPNGRCGAGEASPTFRGEGHRKVWARLRLAGVIQARRPARPVAGRLARRPAPRRHHHPRHHRHEVGNRPDHRGRPKAKSRSSSPRLAECVGCPPGHPLRGARPSARAYAATSTALPARSPPASRFATTTDRNTWPTSNELAFLGIESSPAFVRAPKGNGCAERFIRTLKENLLWVRTFATTEELRLALLAFRETYNGLIERHGFKSPTGSATSSFNPLAA